MWWTFTDFLAHVLDLPVDRSRQIQKDELRMARKISECQDKLSIIQVFIFKKKKKKKKNQLATPRRSVEKLVNVFKLLQKFKKIIVP